MRRWHQKQSTHLLRGVVAESKAVNVKGAEFGVCFWRSAMVAAAHERVLEQQIVVCGVQLFKMP